MELVFTATCLSARKQGRKLVQHLARSSPQSKIAGNGGGLLAVFEPQQSQRRGAVQPVELTATRGKKDRLLAQRIEDQARLQRKTNRVLRFHAA